MQDIETLSLDLDSISVAKTIVCDIAEANKYVTAHGSLNILTQNIRSIACNFSDLNIFLKRSNLNWDILVLTECWLPSSKYIPPLENFNYIKTTVNKTKVEGVVIYYNSKLTITAEEPKLNDANCLLLKINSDFCILGIYRPPSQLNTTNFITSLDLLLQKLNSNKNIIFAAI